MLAEVVEEDPVAESTFVCSRLGWRTSPVIQLKALRKAAVCPWAALSASKCSNCGWSIMGDCTAPATRVESRSCVKRET